MHKTFLSEQSSDNGSVSNSDAEPEMQDSEVEMQEDNVSETVDNVVPENQEFGRNWQRIGPSKDTAIVSCQCVNINEYNIVYSCDYYLFLYAPTCSYTSRVSVTVLV